MMPQLVKRIAMKLLRHLLEGPRSETIGLLIGGHVGEAITIDAILGKTLVQTWQHRDTALLRAIFLRHECN